MPLPLLIRTVALAVLVAISLTAPGFVFLRRLKWDPLEKLAGSMALSLVILYAWGFTAFILRLPPSASLAGVVLTLAAAVYAWPDARRLLARRRVRSVLLMLALLAIWAVALQSVIRNYGGGEWCCDWYEHYEQSVNFVEAKPPDFLYIGRYVLPARPPLMNVVTGYFLALLGQDFALFQVVFSLLNVLVLVPCCLVARLFVPGGVRHRGVIAVLLGANPTFYVNATFTWSKLLAAYFVILAVWFLIVGLRRRSVSRLTAAFACLAAGAMVHYSAVPYAVFLFGVFAFMAWRQPRPFATAARSVGSFAAIAAPWFIWSVHRYGMHGTFLTNTTATNNVQFTAFENLQKMGWNLVDTVVPHWWRGAAADIWPRSLIDPLFMLFQNNVLFAPGLVVTVLALWVLSWRLLSSRSPATRSQKLFWLLFIPITAALGVAVHGERDPTGVAHICLQPLAYLAITFVGANACRWSRAARALLWVGTVVGLLLGVFLHLYLLHSVEEWARTPNWDWKASGHIAYLGDRLAGEAGIVAALLALGSAVAMAWLGRTLLAAPDPAGAARDSWVVPAGRIHSRLVAWSGTRAARRALVGLVLVAALSLGGWLSLRVDEGLTVSYYKNAAISGSPTRTRASALPSTRELTAEWRQAAPARLAAQWVGYLTVLRAGEYRFSVAASGAARLELDNIEVVRHPGREGGDDEVRAVKLAAGPHLFVLSYVASAGAPALEWAWSREGASFSSAPAWQLTASRTPLARLLVTRVLHWSWRLSLPLLALLGGLILWRRLLARRGP